MGTLFHVFFLAYIIGVLVRAETWLVFRTKGGKVRWWWWCPRKSVAPKFGAGREGRDFDHFPPRTKKLPLKIHVFWAQDGRVQVVKRV